MALEPVAWSPLLLWAAAALVGVWTPARRAFGALRAGQVDMNCLMVLAVFGALALGETAEAATVVFLFSVGEMLEGLRPGARTAQSSCCWSNVEVARVEREGVLLEIPARDVAGRGGVDPAGGAGATGRPGSPGALDGGPGLGDG